MLGHSDNVQETQSELLVQLSADTGLARSSEALKISPAGMTSQVVMTSTTQKQAETSHMTRTNSQTFAQRALHARSLDLLIGMVTMRHSLDAQ